MKTLVQCDFDGTITEDDASSVLLDVFAQGDWRELLRQYEQGAISVQELNSRSFAMVKADKAALLEALNGRVKVRPGFQQFVSYCRQRLFRLAVVSNGLEFYIRAILRDLNLEDMEVFSARACFRPEGIEVRYIGPDGRVAADSFKEAYMKSFLDQGYKVIYMGNGDSDVAPAVHAHHVFATGRLLTYGRENSLGFQPLEDFVDVVRRMELLQ